jgi:hypothetical protein
LPELTFRSEEEIEQERAERAPLNELLVVGPIVSGFSKKLTKTLRYFQDRLEWLPSGIGIVVRTSGKRRLRGIRGSKLTNARGLFERVDLERDQKTDRTKRQR